MKAVYSIMEWMAMKTLNEKINEITMHLQTLTKPEFASDVEKALKNEDKASLMKICSKAKIPAISASAVVSVLMSIQPNIKWPYEY